MDSERDVETYLKREVESIGGLCWKFVSPGTRGVPDRWCVLFGQQFFVELKRTNAQKRSDEKLQVYRASQLRKHGVDVYTISSKEEVQALLSFYRECFG